MATFTIVRVLDLPTRGGLLVTGHLADGFLGDGVTMRHEPTGRVARVMVVDFGTPGDASRNRYTVVVDRTEAGWIEPGMELTVPDD